MNNSNQNTLSKIIQSRWILHLAFWILSFYILVRFFSYSDELSTVYWVYTFLFHLSIWAAVYPNLLWLIPKYLRAGRYGFYGLLLIGLALFGVGVNYLIFNWLAQFLFPDFYFISYYTFWEILQFMVVYLAVTTLLKLSKGWFRYLRTERKMEQLEREKLDAELSALRSQVNPHFLFNSLNNLYSLALDQDHRTPDLILRLSKMMRYVLYETNVPTVPLEKEIEHLQNFVEMQRLRVGEQVEIKFTVSGNTEDVEVAPLLFLPLVENAFKHGIKGETENAFLRANLQVTDAQVIFEVANNQGEIDETAPSSARGVGLKNLRRRLDLLYPKQHEFKVLGGETIFTAKLKINRT